MGKIIGIILLIVGIGFISYSTALKPYTDREAFYEKMYSVMDDENKYEEYYKLRQSYLTSKYTFENYGLVAIILGLYSLILIPKNWKDFKTPKTKLTIGIVGFLAVILSIGGYVGDLFLEATRDRYPPWADSLGIPLMSVPFLFLLFSGWFAANLIGLKNSFRTAVYISEFRLKKTNYWYLSLLILTALLVLTLIYEGDFWWTAAGIMWIYFYLSLLLGRQKEKIKTIANTA